MDFLLTLYILNNSTYTNYENIFIELDSYELGLGSHIDLLQLEAVPVSKFLCPKSLVLFISKIFHLD